LKGITPDFKFGEGETKVNIKTTLKSSVAVAALFAVAAPVANAADDTFSSGNKNSLSMSGQVVRMLSHADDGSTDDTFFSDGAWATSRVRWVAKGTLSPNVTAGATIEMNIPTSNDAGTQTLGTHAQDQGDDTTDDTSWDIRHEYVWVNHKKMGKLSFGNTNTASNGRSESEYNGIGMFAASAASSELPNNTWQDTSTASAPAASGVASIGAAIGNFDGGSRSDVVRYDLPSIAGLQLATSMIAGGAWDVGAAYSGKFGGITFKAQAGFLNYGASATSTNFTANGSIAVLHDSGLNATFAAGKTNFSGPASKTDGSSTVSATNVTSGVANDAGNDGVEDPHFYYWGVGYKAKIFGVGGTNFAFGWNQTNDQVQVATVEDAEAQSFAFAVVQSFDAIGGSVGLRYQRLTLDAKNAAGADRTFDDIDIITLGTVFKF